MSKEGPRYTWVQSRPRKSTAKHKCYICLKWKVKGWHVETRDVLGRQQWACDKCMREHDIPRAAVIEAWP